MQLAFITRRKQTKPKIIELREIRLKNRVLESDLAQLTLEFNAHNKRQAEFKTQAKQ